MAKVYNYLTHDIDDDEMRPSPSKAIAEWIERVGGEILRGSEEDVEPALLDPLGRFWRRPTAMGVQCVPDSAS